MGNILNGNGVPANPEKPKASVVIEALKMRGHPMSMVMAAINDEIMRGNVIDDISKADPMKGYDPVDGIPVRAVPLSSGEEKQIRNTPTPGQGEERPNFGRYQVRVMGSNRALVERTLDGIRDPGAFAAQIMRDGIVQVDEQGKMIAYPAHVITKIELTPVSETIPFRQRGESFAVDPATVG